MVQTTDFANCHCLKMTSIDVAYSPYSLSQFSDRLRDSYYLQHNWSTIKVKQLHNISWYQIHAYFWKFLVGKNVRCVEIHVTKWSPIVNCQSFPAESWTRWFFTILLTCSRNLLKVEISSLNMICRCYSQIKINVRSMKCWRVVWNQRRVKFWQRSLSVTDTGRSVRSVCVRPDFPSSLCIG